MAEPLQHTKLVLVEGNDEVNFFSAIKDHMGFSDIEVRSFEGINNLRGTLEALKGVEGFDRLVSLGVVRDAEGNGMQALQSVMDALGASGLPVPPHGLEPIGQNPMVVILINPHGQPNGRFDDVCSDSVRETPVMRCVEEYITCLKRLGIAVMPREWKTRVHAFIAAQDRPEVSLGVAAKRGYFPLGHAAFAPTRTLLELVENR